MNGRRYLSYPGLQPGNSRDDLATDDPTVRALYTGDISATIQERFAQVVIDRYPDRLSFSDLDYYLVRLADNTYVLYVGDIAADGTITSADVYRYQAVNAGGYTTAWTWNESHVQGGSVDLSGYSGYIYSSYPGYQPIRGLPSAKIDSQSHMLLTFLLMFAVICAVGSLIRGWFNVEKR